MRQKCGSGLAIASAYAAVNAFLEAIDEKIGIVKNREKTIRDLAGWMSHQETKELRKSLEVFNKGNEEDWD